MEQEKQRVKIKRLSEKALKRVNLKTLLLFFLIFKASVKYVHTYIVSPSEQFHTQSLSTSFLDHIGYIRNKNGI